MYFRSHKLVVFPFTPNTAYYYHPPAATIALPQPGEIPLLPLTLPQPDFSITAKRRRGDAEDAAAYAAGETEDSALRNRAKGQDVVFRIAVPSRQIGKVTGKEGCRIQKIREDTKATIKIADAIAQHEERVIIISSKDGDNAVSDAENAL